MEFYEVSIVNKNSVKDLQQHTINTVGYYATIKEDGER